MAYQMAATAVTLNDLEGHSPVAGLFNCNPSKFEHLCSIFTLSTDIVLARFLCISRASCLLPALLAVELGLSLYTCVTDIPNLRKIGQKPRSLSWTNSITDRHTDTQIDRQTYSSDYISVKRHALHWTYNNIVRDSVVNVQLKL